MLRCPYTGKLSYSTRKHARKGRDRIFRETGLELRVYRCPDCGLLHLTSLRPHFTRNDYEIGVAEQEIGG